MLITESIKHDAFNIFLGIRIENERNLIKNIIAIWINRVAGAGLSCCYRHGQKLQFSCFVHFDNSKLIVLFQQRDNSIRIVASTIFFKMLNIAQLLYMAHTVVYTHHIKDFCAHSIHLTLTSHMAHSLKPQKKKLKFSLYFFQFELLFF